MAGVGRSTHLNPSELKKGMMVRGREIGIQRRNEEQKKEQASECCVQGPNSLSSHPHLIMGHMQGPTAKGQPPGQLT